MDDLVKAKDSWWLQTGDWGKDIIFNIAVINKHRAVKDMSLIQVGFRVSTMRPTNQL